MGPKPKVVEEAPPEEAEQPEVPKSGYGKFEYVDHTLYVGEWKLQEETGKKVKHGQGKIVFPGAVNALNQQIGNEEYDGDWVEDQMHGQGIYKFTSGNVYSGDWVNGVMTGFGKMVYADGSQYEGQWNNNLMDGEGCYIDADKITWNGIFVEGQYDSKIQKKLQAEKVVKDKINQFEQMSKSFFEQFAEAFGKSDKKTFKDNLTPFFGNTETCIDYVNVENFPKFEDRAADKWNELIAGANESAEKVVKALSQKEDGVLIQPENILADQLKSKAGGQLVEVTAGSTSMVLCQLPAENWVLVYFAEA